MKKDTTTNIFETVNSQRQKTTVLLKLGQITTLQSPNSDMNVGAEN